MSATPVTMVKDAISRLEWTTAQLYPAKLAPPVLTTKQARSAARARTIRRGCCAISPPPPALPPPVKTMGGVRMRTELSPASVLLGSVEISARIPLLRVLRRKIPARTGLTVSWMLRRRMASCALVRSVTKVRESF